MKQELYEQNYQAAGYFSFGKNWQRFLSHLNEAQIQEATLSLEAFLGGRDQVAGKSFVDVGCGSGLFSLAAYRLGAKEVVSIDVDRASVWCVQELHKREDSPEYWKILTGSALDQAFLENLGKFDIIYSWGVLHHTGSMWQALKNLLLLSHQESKLYVALYNDNKKILEGSSPLWWHLKKLYNQSPRGIKKICEVLYADYIFLGLLFHGLHPVQYVRNYHSLRGMDFWTDIRDWLGGYPYEYASIREVTSYMGKLGFTPLKIAPARSLGCNEFLFQASKAQIPALPPLVSVVVPVYNSADTLDQCVQSIFDQTYPAIKGIFINDASTDESLKKLERWQEKYGQEKVLIISNDRNRGVTQSLNRGVQQVSGKYIARLDADDWWAKDKIEKQIAFLESHPDYKIVGCDYVNINGAIQKKVRTDHDDALIKRNIIRHNPFAHSCVVYSTELMKQVGSYAEKIKYGSDYDLFLRMLPFSKFYNIPEFLCYRTIQNEGISIKKQKEQMLQGVRTRINYIRDQKLSPWNYFYIWDLLVVAYTPRFIRNLKRKLIG